MSRLNFSAGDCERMRRLLDSHASNELEERRRNEVHQHLETCPSCAETFAERRRVKQIVQQAVRREEAPEALKQTIREMIRKN